MPVKVNECLERSHQPRQQEARGSLISKETTIHREHNTDGRLNPWVLARMNGLSEVSPTAPNMTLQHSPRSPSNVEPPILRHTMAPPGDLDVPRSQRNAKVSRLPCPQQCTVPGGSYRSPVARNSDNESQVGPDIPVSRSYMSLHRRQRRRGQLPWTPPSSLERGQNADTFPIDSNHSRNATGLKQTQISFGGAQANRSQVGLQGDCTQASPNNAGTNSHLNIQSIFSTAKQNLQYQLSQMGDSLLTETAPSCKRQRRYQEPTYQRQPFSTLQTNSFKNSEPSKEVQGLVTTCLPTGDPRAYLLRRQKSIAAEESDAKPKRLRRLKSCLMPLENIPLEYQTHSLSRSMSLDSRVLDELVQQCRKYDEYVIYGTFVDGIDMSLSEGREMESRLEKLLADQKENIREGKNSEAMIDLQTMLKGKGTANELVA
ncbi:hypothetical protein F4861DRAFT_488864 [Xylaria intraflava]|nr:hypothetical protein F4861DRAFT_488864 [Xylaria intraflava]